MKETKTRLLSGIIYIATLLCATLFSEYTFIVLFGVLLLIATSEFSVLLPLHKNKAQCIAFLIYTLYYLFFFFCNENPVVLNLFLLFATLLVAIKLMILLFSNQVIILKPVLKYPIFLGYLVFPFIILTQIPFYMEKKYVSKEILAIFSLIWINDTFAYIVGKSIGKTKLLEKISPKKTVEGFLGGVVAALVWAVFITYYYQESYIKWISTALLVTIFGTLGDLIESKFKRTAGVKDSGTIMPGHGGILDRLDSIIFASSFIFLFYQIINYVS